MCRRVGVTHGFAVEDIDRIHRLGWIERADWHQLYGWTPRSVACGSLHFCSLPPYLVRTPYGVMAEAELGRILDELQSEMPEIRVAALHRIGSLSVGDAAVVCAASAPHRGEAFAACRELIDRLKARLPIWKREHGPDGPYWVGWEDARCSPEHGDHDHREKHHHHGHHG